MTSPEDMADMRRLNGTVVSYGLRDDVPVVFSISPLGTQRIIEVKGTLRDVIKLVSHSGWRIIMAEVDIDAFLERYHSEEKSRPVRDPTKPDEKAHCIILRKGTEGCPESKLISNYRGLACFLLAHVKKGFDLSSKLTPEFLEEVREFLKEAEL